MKAAELNSNHLGQRFAVRVPGAVVEDTLIGIEHSVDMITDESVGGETNVVPGRRHTSLTFLHVGSIGTDYTQTVLLEPIR